MSWVWAGIALIWLGIWAWIGFWPSVLIVLGFLAVIVGIGRYMDRIQY